MFERWPQVCRVKIKFGLPPTFRTLVKEQLVCFHKNEFDERRSPARSARCSWPGRRAHRSAHRMCSRALMMMIAFITINRGLVPLIEGLCAQI